MSLTGYSLADRQTDLQRIRWLSLCNELACHHYQQHLAGNYLTHGGHQIVLAGEPNPLWLHTQQSRMSFAEYQQHETLDVRVAESALGWPAIQLYLRLFFR